MNWGSNIFRPLVRFFAAPLIRRSAHRKERSRELSSAILGEQRFSAIDVGAAAGVLSHWKTLDGVASIYQIDPRDDACAQLRATNERTKYGHMHTVIAAAVAGSDGPRTLHVSNAPTGTSLFSPDLSANIDCGEYIEPSYFFPIVEQSIETETIDSLLKKQGEAQVDLIKLDIQGAELEAIQGMGRERLADLLGIELEIGMHSIYPDAAKFSDVQRALHDLDFELFDLRNARTHLTKNGDAAYYQKQIFGVCDDSPTIAARLWEVDALYFKKKSYVLSRGNAGLIRRMLICYLTYNFFSEAYGLTQSAGASGILTTAETDELTSSIVELHKTREFRQWHANTKASNQLRALRNRIAPKNGPRWCQYTYQNYPSG